MGALKWITGFFGWVSGGPIGALLGFLFGITLKLAYCATCAGWCAVEVLRR